jgi:hypothetical protein
MFKRKNPELRDIDLLNKFNNVENKIDILNSKFESITYLDGCCNCKERDTKIYEMLFDYFESKFSDFTPKKIEPLCSEYILKQDLDDFKNEVLLELKNFYKINSTFIDEQGSQNLNIKTMFNKITNMVSQLKIIDHQEYHIKHQDTINNALYEISNIGKLILTHEKTSINGDIKLRDDLQSFFIGMQKNLSTQIQLAIKDPLNVVELNLTTHLTDTIGQLGDTINNINSKVDSFYFENELIKHQLLLEENIGKYNDELESLKIRVKNTTVDIDEIFKIFNYTESAIVDTEVSQR